MARNESSHSRVTFIDTWLANIHVRLHQSDTRHSDSVPAPTSSIVNDCASVDSFLAAHRHNLRSVALCPFSIHGVGNTDIVYIRASCLMADGLTHFHFWTLAGLHLDRFSRVCTAHARDQQTDHVTTYTCGNWQQSTSSTMHSSRGIDLCKNVGGSKLHSPLVKFYIIGVKINVDSC